MDPAIAAIDFAKAGAILADMVEFFCCRHPAGSARRSRP